MNLKHLLLPIMLIGLAILCGCTSMDRLGESITGTVDEPVVPGQPAAIDTHRYAKVAVLVRYAATSVYDQNRQAGIVSSVQSAVTEVLLSKGYAIAERSDIDKVVKELNFQQSSGLTDSDAASAGKMLNAQALMMVTINRLTSSGKGSTTTGPQTTLDVSAKLVDIERAATVWQASYSGTHSASVEDCLSPVAHGIVRSFPSSPSAPPPAPAPAAK